MNAEAIARALGGTLMLGSEGRPCFPCAKSKRPISPRGFLDASADPIAPREIWSKFPGPLVGVRTGNTSRIDVLDLDRKHREATEWWMAHRDDFPVTRVHRTRSGGLHLLFQHAPNMRCSASNIAPGIDVRGDGGYVIWWPICRTAGAARCAPCPLASVVARPIIIAAAVSGLARNGAGRAHISAACAIGRERRRGRA